MSIHKIIRHCVMRWSAILLICAIAVTSAGTAHAKKSILSVLFPYLFPAEEEEAGLTQRLDEDSLAPFAQGEAQQGAGTQIQEANDVSLDKPHRLLTDIESWLMEQVSIILNINPYEYEDHLEAIRSVMSPGGIAEFEAFIEESQTLETLQANNMVLTAYVENPPTLLNEAVLKDRYRWLYDIPVALTFTPQGMDSYRQYEPVNQFIILRAQLGRIPPGTNEAELQIETFEVRGNPEK